MKLIIRFIFTLLILNQQSTYSQTCPQSPTNNNGAGSYSTPCIAGDVVPTGWVRSGVWKFGSGPASNLTIHEVYKDGVLYQNSSGLTSTFSSANPTAKNVIFGGYNANNSGDRTMCFYGDQPNWNAPNNAVWKIIFTDANGAQCTYTVTGGGATLALPLIWNSFTAEKEAGEVKLTWSTASEQNTKDFVIQHSLNTTDWSALSTIPAAGNSTTTRNYSYVHQNPLKGNNYNYYRILQRDLDDKFSYSKIVSIIFNEPGADLQVYPNPVQDQLTVFLAETQMVRLINAAGATVWKGQLPAGRNTIPVHTFSKGVYVLTAGMQSQRVLIQ